MATSKRRFTVRDIEAAYENPEWGGYGYLGARQNEPSSAKRRLMDNAILAVANEDGWSKRFFFEFLNSKPGRHFEDELHQGVLPTRPELSAKLRRSYVSWLLKDPLFSTRGVHRVRHPLRGNRASRRSIDAERRRRVAAAKQQPRRKTGEFR